MFDGHTPHGRLGWSQTLAVGRPFFPSFAAPLLEHAVGRAMQLVGMEAAGLFLATGGVGSMGCGGPARRGLA
jgi:hypothetical protein